MPASTPCPRQVQLHGPEPLTGPDAPETQRSTFGSSGMEVPLAVPQRPGPVAVLTAAQLAVTPGLWQVQTHAPLPLSVAVLAVPPLHNPDTGADADELPLAGPQVPMPPPPDPPVFGAEQLALVEPLPAPRHCHIQVLPPFVTGEGVPEEHSDAGVTPEATPSAAPHAPLAKRPRSLHAVEFPAPLTQPHIQ